MQSLSAHIAFHEILSLQECFEETAIFQTTFYFFLSSLKSYINCSPLLASYPPVAHHRVVRIMSGAVLQCSFSDPHPV